MPLPELNAAGFHDVGRLAVEQLFFDGHYGKMNIILLSVEVCVVARTHQLSYFVNKLAGRIVSYIIVIMLAYNGNYAH